MQRSTLHIAAFLLAIGCGPGGARVNEAREESAAPIRESGGEQVQPPAPDAARARGQASVGEVEGERLAKACPAEPGSILDVASEPGWRAYAEYAAWTDVKGCLVRIDVLAERPGPSHCDWQDTRVIITGVPLGTRYAKQADSRNYVRDPNGSYGNASLQAAFDAHAVLPSGARDSGFRREEFELWVDPNDDSAIYVKGPDAVERWPRGEVPACQ